MRLRNSFWALLGQQGEAEAPEAVLERVRDAIQAALFEQLGQDGVDLIVRVRFARDIDSLWYLRPEIMNAIASRCGEGAARACMTRLTLLFKEHHPGATSSRFGAL
jgi:hypothetical protein